MAPISDDLENYRDVSLRIWFDDGTNGREQLGKDQPLLVAPYALSAMRPAFYENLETLALDLEEVALLNGEHVSELIARLALVAMKTEAGGIVVHDMLSTAILDDLNRTIVK